VGLIDDLRGGPVALDTAIFIYFIEEHPVFLPTVEPVFTEIQAGRLEAVTSTLTLLETLVIPYRAGNAALAEQYEALLAHSGHLRLVELDRALLRAAAQLRAHVRIKTPDSLQVAAALATGCTTLLTNDRRLPPIPGLAVVELTAYAKTQARRPPSAR
jgi:predicted nucleic acid-binding protein